MFLYLNAEKRSSIRNPSLKVALESSKKTSKSKEASTQFNNNPSNSSS